MGQWLPASGPLDMLIGLCWAFLGVSVWCLCCWSVCVWYGFGALRGGGTWGFRSGKLTEVQKARREPARQSERSAAGCCV